MPWTVFFLTVLSRVKDFLPVMREAELALEQELQVKSPTELDIESVDDGAPFIEMVSIYPFYPFFLAKSVTWVLKKSVKKFDVDVPYGTLGVRRK